MCSSVKRKRENDLIAFERRKHARVKHEAAIQREQAADRSLLQLRCVSEVCLELCCVATITDEPSTCEVETQTDLRIKFYLPTHNMLHVGSVLHVLLVCLNQAYIHHTYICTCTQHTLFICCQFVVYHVPCYLLFVTLSIVCYSTIIAPWYKRFACTWLVTLKRKLN